MNYDRTTKGLIIMRSGICLLLTTCLLDLGLPSLTSPASAALQVVAATPELADIARQVGGNKVSVYSIAKPNQDYHMIEARPSDVAKIGHADLVVRVGMDLDLWLDALINAAGNQRVGRGGSGYVDASVGIPKLEVPHETITGASGDIHVFGNPHYFYDPVNGKIIADNIRAGLARVSPANGPTFNANCQRFKAKIDQLLPGWTQALAPYRGRPVVIYHASAIYFLHRFGLKDFGTLEVKPGIPPSASHVNDLIRSMKAGGVRALVVESVYPRQFPDMVVRETGAKLQITPYSVGSLGTKDYFDMISMWVAKYKAALQ
jgi:ABC-type Zn uptake system ZnuABC Zn-binding protein ZnuA